MTTTAPRNLITLEEAAAYWRVTPRTIRRHINAGHLTGYRIGPRSIRVDQDELEAQTTKIQEDHRE